MSNPLNNVHEQYADLQAKVEELTSARCTWKKIDGMRAYKMCKGGTSRTNYLTPYCPNCGRRVVEQEGE